MKYLARGGWSGHQVAAFSHSRSWWMAVHQILLIGFQKLPFIVLLTVASHLSLLWFWSCWLWVSSVGGSRCWGGCGAARVVHGLLVISWQGWPLATSPGLPEGRTRQASKCLRQMENVWETKWEDSSKRIWRKEESGFYQKGISNWKWILWK